MNNPTVLTVTGLPGMSLHVEEPEQLMQLSTSETHFCNNDSRLPKPVDPRFTSGDSAPISDDLSGVYFEFEAEETHNQHTGTS